MILCRYTNGEHHLQAGQDERASRDARVGASGQDASSQEYPACTAACAATSAAATADNRSAGR